MPDDVTPPKRLLRMLPLLNRMRNSVQSSDSSTCVHRTKLPSRTVTRPIRTPDSSNTTHEQLAGGDVNAEEIATDIHIVGSIAGVDEWRTVERRRRDPEDLGDVFDEAGMRIGRVTGRDGSFVR